MAMMRLRGASAHLGLSTRAANVAAIRHTSFAHETILHSRGRRSTTTTTRLNFSTISPFLEQVKTKEALHGSTTAADMAATESHTARVWDQQPPYAYASGAEAEFEKKHEGRCQCGRVKYWLKREAPLSTKYCHCRGCQRLHGAPFQWAAIFHKEDMVFENGTKDLVFYNSGERTLGHDLPCKVSCAHCRSPIMDEGRRMVLLFPTLISFKDKAQRDQFYPQSHIFYSARVVDIPDGKPKWDGLDGSSKLLEDES